MPNIRRLLLLGAICGFLLPGVVAAEAKLDLKDYKGNVVYLDFWASWCVPCKKSFPWMEQIQKKYKDRGLRIIAVNLDENPADADTFLRKFPSSFTVIRDPKGELAERYQVKGMPTALLYDVSGNLVGRHIGFRNAEKPDYEDAIVQLLPATGAKK